MLVLEEKSLDDDQETGQLFSILKCSIVGPVDSGKTSLFQKFLKEKGINSNFVAKESSKITQTLRFVKLNLIDDSNKSILIIDTPGHETLANLKHLASLISDVIILIFDVTIGNFDLLQRAIEQLPANKKLIVCINKIDKIRGWKSVSKDFLTNLNSQSSDTRDLYNSYFKKLKQKFFELECYLKAFYEKLDQRYLNLRLVSCCFTSFQTDEGFDYLLKGLKDLSKRSTKIEKRILVIASGLSNQYKKFYYILLENRSLREGQYLYLGDQKLKIKELFIESKDRLSQNIVRGAEIVEVIFEQENILKSGLILFKEAKNSIEKIIEDDLDSGSDSTTKNKNYSVLLISDSINRLEALEKSFISRDLVVVNSLANFPNANQIQKLLLATIKRGLLVFYFEKNKDIIRAKKQYKPIVFNKIDIIAENSIFKINQELEAWLSEQSANEFKTFESTNQKLALIVFLKDYCFKIEKTKIIHGIRVLEGTLEEGITITDKNGNWAKIETIQLNKEKISRAVENQEVSLEISFQSFKIDYSEVYYNRDINIESYYKFKRFLSKSQLRALKTIDDKTRT